MIIDGKTFAKLEKDIDITSLKIPEEMQGDNRCEGKGKSILYYNKENLAMIAIKFCEPLIDKPRDFGDDR